MTGTMQHGTTLLNGATACRMAGRLERSLAFYLQAETIFLKNREERSYPMAGLYNNISQLYQDMHAYESALKYQPKALDLIQEFTGNDAEIATTHVNMSHTYMALGQLQKADEALAEALRYYESETGSHDSHYGAALNAMGLLAFQKKDPGSAIHWLQEALQLELRIFGENDACRMIRANLEYIKKTLRGSQEEGTCK